MNRLPEIDWSQIDVALIDMDGTLLDLRYDNVFWMDYLPGVYAEKHSISREESLNRLTPLFAQNRGTLNWYCIDYWTATLDMDVAAMKPAVSHLVQWHVGAQEFLDQLAENGVERWLATNAHRASFSVKDARLGLTACMDKIISAHDLGYPKEEPGFWQELENQHDIDLGRCLLVDDNVSALTTARQAGLGYTIAITQPDTGGEAVDPLDFPAVTGLEGLLDKP